MGLLRLLTCLLVFLGAGAVALPVAANPGETPLKVRVQLKWFHQYQFAGFYAALEQGYFRRAGLDVELIEGNPEVDLAGVVASGAAEFGIGNSSLLIDFNRGLPVVAVAAIFQHSPFIILARVDPQIRSIKDLEGRTLMGESHSAELTAYLKKAGVDLGKVRQVTHSGSVKSLAADAPDRVDATTAYISTEPVEASQYGIPYQIFNPRELDIDFYGDTLFTSQRFAREHPQAVAAMRDALAEGWHYAYRHQAEVIDLILEKYHPRMDRMTLTLEAQSLYNLFLADIVDIGYMSRTRWQEIARIFAETGLLPASYTESTLAGDMTEIAKYVLDPELKAKLKENKRIGTPATQAPTITELIDKGYIFVNKEVLYPSAFGMSIIHNIPKELTDPGVTALWETDLALIAEGKMNPKEFMERIDEFSGKLLKDILARQGRCLIQGQRIQPKKAASRSRRSGQSRSGTAQGIKQSASKGKSLASASRRKET